MDVVAGGELLPRMVRIVAEELLFSVLGGTAPLMNLQKN